MNAMIFCLSALALFASCQNAPRNAVSNTDAPRAQLVETPAETVNASATNDGVAQVDREKKKEDKVEKAPKVEDGAKADLGKLAPEFALKDLDGKEHKLSDYRGKLVVIEWFNPKCPFVVAAYSKGPLKEMRQRYATQGIVWLAVNSGAPGQQGTDLAENKQFLEDNGAKQPLLIDPTGVVGKAYAAKTTPHMYVINEKGVLVYRGALDNAPFGKVEPEVQKANYVDAAIKDIKAGHAVTTAETNPYGCSVKYRN